MTKLIPKAELLYWISLQPDARPVDLSQGEISYGCGCIMVHYGLEQGIDFTACSSMDWVHVPRGEKVAETEDSVFRMFKLYDFKVSGTTTYGELKEHLKKKGFL